MTNFQILMRSPNLLKSKSPIMKVGVGVGGGVVGDDQCAPFDAESKFAKISKSHCSGDWALVTINFQLLMLSPNLLKTQSPIMVWMGVG